MTALANAVVRVPGLRRLLLSPGIARPGYWIVTGAAFLWGSILLGHRHRRDGLHYFDHLPRWAFGRGGTTVGAIYLTCDNTGDGVLLHEQVHTVQWRTYGLCFIPLYVAAGADARDNRFEIEAGLQRGGY